MRAALLAALAVVAAAPALAEAGPAVQAAPLPPAVACHVQIAGVCGIHLPIANELEELIDSILHVVGG